MKIKYFFLIILFQIALLGVNGQNIDDILQRQENSSTEQTQQAEPKSKQVKKAKEEQKNQPASTEQTEQKEEIIMAIDYDIPKGNSSADAGLETPAEINAKWRKYLSDRTQEMLTLYNNILEIDSDKITKEQIDEFVIEVNMVKEKFDSRLGSGELWKDNDELDEMRAEFSATYSRTIKKLNYLEAQFGNQEKPMHPLFKWGIGLLALMVVIPIFTQVKSAFTVKKAKKQAKQLAEKQMKEAEKQMLLNDEANIIKLT